MSDPAAVRRFFLLLRALAFVVLLPGTIAVYVPWRVLSSANGLRVPAHSVAASSSAFLVIAGAAVLLRCVWDFFATGQGTLAPVDPPKRLVITGLYRVTRNPMYNGVAAMLIGEAWLFRSVAIAEYAVVVFVGFNLFVILYEERTLSARFGDEYRAYRSAVPRWGFTIRPYHAVLTLLTVLGLASSSSAQGPARDAPTATPPFVVPQWAFPTAPPPNPPLAADSVTKHRVPRSARSFTQREAQDPFDVIDWFPQTHPEMPASVRYGRRPDPRGCAYCHLPSGGGRPENAMLAGLPADYIVRQVTAFRDGTRLSANPTASTNSMHLVARAATDAEVAEAAAYFASLRPARRNRIVETDRAPRTRIAVMLYVYERAGTEPIAGRLIETPAAYERHELHDPLMVYTTYVPRGSLAEGRQLATDGPAGAATVCASCHGPKLLGQALAPPIAGRSPTYVLRQLLNFRSGARHEPGSEAMQSVVRALTVDEMVSVAAWVGSRPPSTR